MLFLRREERAAPVETRGGAVRVQMNFLVVTSTRRPPACCPFVWQRGPRQLSLRRTLHSGKTTGMMTTSTTSLSSSCERSLPRPRESEHAP